MVRTVRLVLIFVASIIALSVASHKTQAVSASQWKPGRIIDDAVFTNKDGMSVLEIQDFLDTNVGTIGAPSISGSCDTMGAISAYPEKRFNGTRAQWAAANGYSTIFTCLNNYYEVPKVTPGAGIPANNYGYAPGTAPPAGSKSAAQLIWDAAQQYDINPKVLIVTIHKESDRLITDDWPLLGQYTYAMGAHCPDSGPGGSANCDPNYAGFSIQIRESARQFRDYLDGMDQPWWGCIEDGINVQCPANRQGGSRPGESYKVPYTTNFILWNIKESRCGGENIYIENKATAALYYYTPYQPNEAALNYMYSGVPISDPGKPCAAYGNRNFWRMYNDWFGSTLSEPQRLNFKSHLSYMGWTTSSIDNGITGTVGQSRPMEAIKIIGKAEYSTYNVTTGWQPTVSDGMISGTENQRKTIQAIRISLTAPLSTTHDLYYRAHVSNIGWMGWAAGGEVAGVTGGATKNIEAIQIRLVPKGTDAPLVTTPAYQNNSLVTYNPPLSLTVASHISNVGWQPNVTDGMISGTTEQGKRMEAVKITANNTTGLTGSVKYSAHVSGIGWQNFVASGGVGGTTGQARRLEALRIALNGELAENYDIWYRAHVQYVGWMNWSKNGEPVGSVGLGRQLEAIEVRLAPKGAAPLPEGGLLNPNNVPTPSTFQLAYASHVSGIGWMSAVGNGQLSGTTGQSKSIESIKITKATSQLGALTIKCSVYVKGVGWSTPVDIGTGCGTTGQSKPIESMRLTLDGEAASNYELTYKAHISFVGWKNWVSSGSAMGTPNSGKNIEAIMVKITKKP